MKKSLISNYIILWIHLINLSLRLFYENKLDDVEILKLNMDDINSFLNNIFSADFIFDDGKLDILTVFTALGSFYLSKYYEDSLIMLIISTVIIEVFIIYNNKNGRLLNTLLIVTSFYLIGKFLRKNKNTYLLEKSLKNDNVYDEINIQEYEPYKLY
jgi:hypothetical protein